MALHLASACEHPFLYLCVPGPSTHGVHMCGGRRVGVVGQSYQGAGGRRCRGGEGEEGGAGEGGV